MIHLLSQLSLLLKFSDQSRIRLSQSLLPQHQLLDTVDLHGVQIFLVWVLFQCSLHQDLVQWTLILGRGVEHDVILSEMLQVFSFLIQVQIDRILVEEDSFEDVFDGLRAADFAQMLEDDRYLILID